MKIYIHTKNTKGEINKMSVSISQTDVVKRKLIDRLNFTSEENGEFKFIHPTTKTQYVLSENLNYVF